MKRVILKKNEELRIKRGHLWVFSNEIQTAEGDPLNGDLVDIFDYKINFLATGFYNTNSLIAVRIISLEQQIDLENIFTTRILSAYNYRKSVYPNRSSFRVVFCESDLLPGLIIDKYNNTFVLQVNSAGIEKNIEIINTILKKSLNAEKIISRNDEYFRKLEGLSAEDKIYFGNSTENERELIDDGHVKYEINLVKGQKTGFYFDQCDNRKFFGKFCNNKSILDCFCNSGGFGLHAAINRASKITFVDSSINEIESAIRNYELNNLSNQREFFCEDVFEYLEKCIAADKKFDIVNIDPPAFAKSKKSLPKAIKGYEKLNRLAIAVIKKGGILFSSSCSYHLKKDQFMEAIKNALQKSQRNFQLVYTNSASLDHPSLLSMEETSYLKFAMFREIN
ncbi:MAG: class I SAM-dependent rRNA methyltransferase [Ignavibacteria bacterium]|nr:class I SAM-dependent rRNA methyltransferase [Ignavibacteria bacterium]